MIEPGSDAKPHYMYPWNNSIDGLKANYSYSGDPHEGVLPETAPVGYYDGNQQITPPAPVVLDMANGHGLYDAAGNEWEWCHD